MEKNEMKEMEKLALGAIRATVIDVTNRAKSGHPGMALDAAPTMLALYRDHLVADPSRPEWINRDRLVFSSGHASALLYTMLHVTGYDVSKEDLMAFRQLGSRTPGHPEVGVTAGVDASGGPLGQGIAQAVGMAIAEVSIRGRYDEGEKLMGHYTYCLCGDGCLEEGISQEAISLAGHLRLNKLILFYDENGATLDGPTSDSLTENVKLRFLSAEWNVLEVEDGEDIDKISAAIAEAKQSKAFPTVIIVHSKIGFGSKNEGSHVTHGSPLGEEDGAYAKERYGYSYPPFEIPREVYEYFGKTFVIRGNKAYDDYEEFLGDYRLTHKKEFAELCDAFDRKVEGYLPPRPEFAPDYKKASRQTSGEYLSALLPSLPFTLGGSADVAGSTNTNVKGIERFDSTNTAGRDMRYGIREFAMAAINNGILLHGGIVAYCAAFFVFADYMKPALRMAALQELPSIYILTHDSLAVGEDGPTHQPIEQLAMLRAIPNFNVFRPADGNEVVAGYEVALESKKTPTALILSRQGLPLLYTSDVDKAKKGAYLVFGKEDAEFEVIATGSEVRLVLDALNEIETIAPRIKVISMPSFELFEAQDEEYKASILSCDYEKRMSVECGSTFGWAKYAKHNFGVDRFGASGKVDMVLGEYGFTKDNIAKLIEEMVLGK